MEREGNADPVRLRYRVGSEKAREHLRVARVRLAFQVLLPTFNPKQQHHIHCKNKNKRTKYPALGADCTALQLANLLIKLANLRSQSDSTTNMHSHISAQGPVSTCKQLLGISNHPTTLGSLISCTTQPTSQILLSWKVNPNWAHKNDLSGPRMCHPI